MLHCDTHVEQRVFLVFDDTTNTSRQVHFLQHHSYDDGHLTAIRSSPSPQPPLPFAATTPHRPRQQISTVVNYKPKGQDVQLPDISSPVHADRTRFVFPVTLPFLYQFRQIHAYIFYLRCKIRYFTGNTFSPHLFLTAFLHTNRHNFLFSLVSSYTRYISSAKPTWTTEEQTP